MHDLVMRVTCRPGSIARDMNAAPCDHHLEPETGVVYAVGADLSNRNFDNLNLQNAVFDKADLSNTSFKNANIDGARFVFANLDHSNLLDRIDLSNVNLAGTDLSNINLKGKDLSRVKSVISLFGVAKGGLRYEEDWNEFNDIYKIIIPRLL